MKLLNYRKLSAGNYNLYDMEEKGLRINICAVKNLDITYFLFLETNRNLNKGRWENYEYYNIINNAFNKHDTLGYYIKKDKDNNKIYKTNDGVHFEDEKDAEKYCVENIFREIFMFTNPFMIKVSYSVLFESLYNTKKENIKLINKDLEIEYKLLGKRIIKYYLQDNIYIQINKGIYDYTIYLYIDDEIKETSYCKHDYVCIIKIKEEIEDIMFSYLRKPVRNMFCKGIKEENND